MTSHMDNGDVMQVCMQCGSRNLDFLSSFTTERFPAGFVLPGVRYGIATCEDCGFEGIPILFDSEKDLRKYVRAFGE
ncbi:MAG: hypothetical protein ABH851_09505 [Methanobacteriota archaeon]